MFKHILVPTDGSQLSDDAVRKAIAFAKDSGARLTIFTAVAEPPMPMTSFGEDARYDPEKPKRFTEAIERQARQILDAAVESATQSGVDADSALETSASPWQAIIRVAEDRQCDLIFMASHGRRGFDALLLGSETHKVLTHCRIPVLVCR